MEDRGQKVGILFSLPVCIIATLFVFPVGFILIFIRLYKKGKICSKVKNIGVGACTALIGLLVVGVLTLPEVDVPEPSSRPGSSGNSSPAPAAESVPAEQPNKIPDEIPTDNYQPPNVTPSSEVPTPSMSALPETEPEPVIEPELSPYESLLAVIRSDIDLCLAADPQDTKSLRDNYELLLSLYVNEYVYKTFGYGYFTDDYETGQFDYLLDRISETCLEMKEYFEESEVDEYLTYCTRMAGRSYDQFDFKEYLIGDSNSPDLDAMWEAHIASSIGLDTENNG